MHFAPSLQYPLYSCFVLPSNAGSFVNASNSDNACGHTAGLLACCSRGAVVHADQWGGVHVQIPPSDCPRCWAQHGSDWRVCLCSAVGCKSARSHALPSLHAAHGLVSFPCNGLIATFHLLFKWHRRPLLTCCLLCQCSCCLVLASMLFYGICTLGGTLSAHAPVIL